MYIYIYKHKKNIWVFENISVRCMEQVEGINLRKKKCKYSECSTI